MGSCCSSDDPGYPVTVMSTPTAAAARIIPTPHQYQPYNPSQTYPQPPSQVTELYPPLQPSAPAIVVPSQFLPSNSSSSVSCNDAGYKWVRRSAGEPLPHGAVVGGRDVDGAQIYVGRAEHEGDIVPAKIIPEKSVAYVAHAGREWAKHHFEVLTVGEFNWIFANNGTVPPDAVVAGHTSSGEPLYVGRVVHNGSQTIGKVQPSHGCVYIPFGGDELSFRDYEVLVMH
ncbi:hypothetical protein QAD02_010858 [Eretmocerus hayati]|uniref:Uncharacterized protein n=1 Tax=Eretmocerus hayati TaxID=131215 RepID=A0ACC2NXZ1_9HYME|nr:hypothetical protein QAD02_010858 [Eretmocerus hayati]